MAQFDKATVRVRTTHRWRNQACKQSCRPRPRFAASPTTASCVAKLPTVPVAPSACMKQTYQARCTRVPVQAAVAVKVLSHCRGTHSRAVLFENSTPLSVAGRLRLGEYTAAPSSVPLDAQLRNAPPVTWRGRCVCERDTARGHTGAQRYARLEGQCCTSTETRELRCSRQAFGCSLPH